MVAVGKKIPNIKVKAIDKLGIPYDLNLLEYSKINKKKILLFWYPKDFTFVCPTELHAFEDSKTEFEKRNCQIIGASCDTVEVHSAWLDLEKKFGGIKGITYPLIGDSNRNLSSVLGILDGIDSNIEYEELPLFEGDNVSYRATYLFDEQGLVFHQSINHMPIGRSTDEYLRLLDAYTHFQHHGEVCPANWKKGDQALVATKEGLGVFFNKKR